MRRVIVVAFDGATTLDVVGPAEVFAAAAQRVGARAYRLLLASVGGGEIDTTSTVRLRTEELLRVRAAPSDSVIVSGGREQAVLAAMANQPLLAWLRRAAPVVERTASVCSGAFLLAAAGLLDGLRATTHWSACDRLAALYPRVAVDRNAIFVADGKVWTSAGVTTGIDMSLALVERDYGPAVANSVAAGLVLYVRRPGFQKQFSEALLAQAESSHPLGHLLSWIRMHLDRADVNELARAAALSVRTLHRRCREHFGLTPAKLIEEVRLEHARTLLATTDISTKRLAIECGFGTTTNLKRTFDRRLGMSPPAYRLLHARPG